MIRLPFPATTFVLLALAFGGMCAHARQGELPYSLAHRAKVGINLPIEYLSAIDAGARRIQADGAAQAGVPRTKRLRVADANAVSITPERNGLWESLADGSRIWRVRISAAGATDLRVRFDRFALPPAATLHVIGADDYYQGPYTANDAPAARFNTPVVPGDMVTIELHIPAATALAAGAIEITRVGVGFRDLFHRAKDASPGPGASGACNVNVVCPLGQPYPDEIRAVGYYEYEADDDRNTYLCSGTLLADVPRDHRNYFLTAAHCAGTPTEAASMVVYWNYQSTQCAVLSAPPGGFFNDDLHGATLRATRTDADFSLVELAQPPEDAWNVYRAGWDATGAQPVATIGIHHPFGDAKKITAGPAPSTTSNCIAGGAPGTHWQAGPYAQGTTEGGSSGSGLFVAANDGLRARLLIGTLTGGDAACSTASPTQPNGDVDCYGKFSAAWNGASAATRLRDWLDPANTGTTSLQGGDPAPPTQVLRHSTRAIPAILLDRGQHR